VPIYGAVYRENRCIAKENTDAVIGAMSEKESYYKKYQDNQEK